MNDPPTLSLNHLAPRGRQLRPASDSPTCYRSTDDLLSSLTPRAAVEAFRNPSGSLKECMNHATPAEQAFAIRAAIASKNIQEWLEELLAWPWPSGGGSAGFEMPVAKRRVSPSDPDPDLPATPQTPTKDGPEQHTDTQYCGSLLTSEVARYSRRIDEISRDMEELNVEEIKSQVLHNHIMPLSRPGSPMMDSNRSVASSLSAFVRMDDLTALITATVLQALPNLSKLTRLMNSWSLRLLVLRKIPVFMTSLADGEIALQSGWNAISSGPKAVREEDSPTTPYVVSPSTLSRKEFGVMKSILERKVAKAGRDLDAMLDILEGWEDTLPEDWIDRVDSLEREYGEWTVSCEKKIREADWARLMQESLPAPAPVSELKGGPVSMNRADPEKEAKDNESNQALQSIPLRVDRDTVSPAGTEGDSETSSVEEGISQHSSGPSETLTSLDMPTRPRDDSPPAIKVHLPPDEPAQPIQPSGYRQSDVSEMKPEHEAVLQSVEDEASGSHDEQLIDSFDGPQVFETPSTNKSREESDSDFDGRHKFRESVQSQAESYCTDDAQSGRPYLDFDSDDMSELDVPQPDLPVLPRPRRGSGTSGASTIVHGPQSSFVDFSSDQLEHGTPELPRLREVDYEAIPSDDLSPANSPQPFRSSTRSLSVSFNDMPTVAEVPCDESSTTTPLNSSFAICDEVSRDFGSPSKMSSTSADDQLQQQISEILESVPAKIRLTSEPAVINLNPPDFKMPTRKPPKQDPTLRSHSSLSTVSNMSSRAGTPSFTLAPAYGRNSRARHQRGNQEIKLYHLSRSNGEAPIKLFIRCVGERGERVMVRVGGGWADLGEYLKEYASHHGRRSGGEGKVEIKDLPRVMTGRAASTPPTRPASAQETYSPVTPLNVRKVRKPVVADDAASGQGHSGAGSAQPKTPLASGAKPDAPSSNASTRSRSSSRLSWDEEDSSLGMAGPRGKQVEMSEESKAWVESVKEKVRIASGERKVSEPASAAMMMMDGKFGEMGKVGATKRLFRRQG